MSHSAYNRGIQCFKNGEEFAQIAQKLAGSKDMKEIAALKHRVVDLVAANPLPGTNPTEEMAHLKQLGPIELAREVAWRAEDQYGNAKRHFDITLIEMAAQKNVTSPIESANGRGGSDNGSTPPNPTPAVVNNFVNRIDTEVAAIQLFVEIQVPGPSYYKKRAQSKMEAQPYFGIGGSSNATSNNTSSRNFAASEPPLPPAPSGMSALIGDLEKLAGGGGSGGAGGRKPNGGASGRGPASSSSNPDLADVDAFLTGSMQIPSGGLGEEEGGGGDEGRRRGRSANPADDYLSLLAAATSGGPPPPSRPPPQQQYSAPPVIPSYDGPVVGLPILDPPSSSHGGGAPSYQHGSNINYDAAGIYSRQHQPTPPANAGDYRNDGYNYDPNAYSKTTPNPAMYDPTGLYSAKPASANQNNFSNGNPSVAANNGVPLPPIQPQRQTQPSPPPPPPPAHTQRKATTEDDYLALLSGALGGGASKTASSSVAGGKKPTASGAGGGSSAEAEYLAILEQMAANKKKAQQLALQEEKAKAEAEAKEKAEKEKKDKEASAKKPTPTPPPPAAGGGKKAPAGGGGGGGAPPPMPSSFKAMVKEMDGIGSVHGESGGGLGSNAINARNAAHTLSEAGANYAPKTSQFVLKGVEISTALMRQGQYKKSVDILQHVFDQGKLETHNTRTFESSMTAAIVDARKRYYEHFPPRLLQVNPISDEEMKLLQDSGKTSTAFFPIWDDVNEGYAAENVYYPAKPNVVGGGGSGQMSLTEGWEDPFSPHLSEKQKKAGARWIRAPKILEQFADKDVVGTPMSPSASSPTADENATNADIATLTNTPSQTAAKTAAAGTVGLITTCDPLAIKQTIVGDCSLVCSLIVCASFQRRFQQGKIIANVIFPQEAAPSTSTSNTPTTTGQASHLSFMPVVNASGKYCVKMLVNGITRMIVVDDRLPAVPATDKHLPILACSYSTDPREMWVSLMEKAFVKVCGGTYDFPGSNSSTDLYHLSGWLPDYLAIDGANFDANMQWQRLAIQHRRGALLATLNTPSNMNKETSEKLKLIPGHAYAILDMRETLTTPTRPMYKLVKIKNPWTKDNSWEGMFSPKDTDRMTPDLRNELGYTDEETKRGVFWMCWDDVCRYFSRIHLSWNPYCLFSGANGSFVKPTRIARHGQWQYTNALSQKPQYDIMAKNNTGKKTRLHLVLSRHIINLDEYNIKAGKRGDQVDPDNNNPTPSPNGLGVFDECPQVRPGNNNINSNLSPSSPTGGDGDAPDPADYVPLITVHIYDTTAYPTIAQSVINHEPVGSFCGGGKWPAEGSQALLAQLSSEGKNGRSLVKTPLMTTIERLPTVPGSVGLPVSVTSAASASALTASAKGNSHMTTSFTGRRVDNATQLPTSTTTDEKTGTSIQGTLVHNGIYKNVPHQTISFDCPPTFGSEIQHFTVVVSQLLPKSEREAKPNAPRPKYPALRSFPFSLTLHSELPMLDRDTSAALLRRDPAVTNAIRDRSFINMTAIPTVGQLPFASRVKGHWIGGMNCGGKVGLKTFGFNPQFLLTIPPPPSPTSANASLDNNNNGGPTPSPSNTPFLTHLLAKLSAPSAAETMQVHVVCLKDYIASLVTQQQRDSAAAGGGGGGGGGSQPSIPPWYGRLYNITDEEAKFVLSCERYGWQSAAVDTSLSNCLSFDDTDSLKRKDIVLTPSQPASAVSRPTPTASNPPLMSPTNTSSYSSQPIALPKLLPVGLKIPSQASSSPSPSSGNSAFFFPFGRQKVSLILLPLIADGVVCSPLVTRAVHSGQQLPLVGSDGNPAMCPTIAQTPQGSTLITAATAPVEQKLRQVFGAPNSSEAVVKMMNNAGTEASILQLITVIPAADSIADFFKTAGKPNADEMVSIWQEIVRLARVVLSNFAAWYNASNWSEACDVISERELASAASGNKPSVLLANQYLRRRFAGGGGGSNASPPSPMASARRTNAEKALVLLNEEILRVLTRLDKFGVDNAENGGGADEAMRSARKGLVAVANAVLHEATDELSKAFADVDRLQQEGLANQQASSTQNITITPSVSEAAVPVTVASTPLNRLPPGQYVIVMSQWTSGTPSPFELIVETEVPHIITEIPPEGCENAPDKPSAAANSNSIVGYKKWNMLNINGTFSNPNPNGGGGFLRCSQMYDRALSLTSALFQAYPSITIFVPSSAAPTTLAIRVIISPPQDASDKERTLPATSVGSGQLLLFSEPPDGNGTLIGDSGDEASATDIALIVTNNKNLSTVSATKTFGNTKVLGAEGGATRINLNTATLVGGRKYRLLLVLRPALSFRNGAQLQFMARIYSSVAGATATLVSPKQ